MRKPAEKNMKNMWHLKKNIGYDTIMIGIDKNRFCKMKATLRTIAP